MLFGRSDSLLGCLRCSGRVLQLSLDVANKKSDIIGIYQFLLRATERWTAGGRTSKGSVRRLNRLSSVEEETQADGPLLMAMRLMIVPPQARHHGGGGALMFLGTAQCPSAETAPSPSFFPKRTAQRCLFPPPNDGTVDRLRCFRERGYFNGSSCDPTSWTAHSRIVPTSLIFGRSVTVLLISGSRGAAGDGWSVHPLACDLIILGATGAARSRVGGDTLRSLSRASTPFTHSSLCKLCNMSPHIFLNNILAPASLFPGP